LLFELSYGDVVAMAGGAEYLNWTTENLKFHTVANIELDESVLLRPRAHEPETTFFRYMEAWLSSDAV